jgi:hypothetical protein
MGREATVLYKGLAPTPSCKPPAQGAQALVRDNVASLKERGLAAPRVSALVKAVELVSASPVVCELLHPGRPQFRRQLGHPLQPRPSACQLGTRPS